MRDHDPLDTTRQVGFPVHLADISGKVVTTVAGRIAAVIRQVRFDRNQSLLRIAGELAGQRNPIFGLTINLDCLTRDVNCLTLKGQ